MATPISVSHSTLSYPLYACAFDPQDASKLFVAGGGGPGRNGVGNKITLLSSSNSDAIEEIAEAELSKEEDNVTTLAVGQHKAKTTLLYAGVNSSPADLKEGKNEHLRTFKFDEPAGTRSKTAPKITESAKVSLFTSKSKDIYQRILRLSAPQGNRPQIGVIATGLAGEESEVVLFEVGNTATPKKLGRIELSKEAVDADVFQTGKDEYLLVYATDLDIWAQKITADGPQAPVCVYDMPGQHPTEKPTIPAFRALRIIAKDFILVLTNIHGRSGAVAQILRLDTLEEGSARLAGSLRLPATVTQGTGLAFANLNPPVTPGEQDATEYIFAVTAQDNSVLILSSSLRVVATVRQITIPKLVHTLTDVHPLQITGLTFSPVQASETNAEEASVKLATVSVGNTVAIHNISLASKRVEGADVPQYYLPSPPRVSSKTRSTILAILAVILAILAQAGLEITGSISPILGVRNHVPEHWLSPYPLLPPEHLKVASATPIAYASSSGAQLSDSELHAAIEALQLGNPDQVVILQDHASDSDAAPTISPAIHDPEIHGDSHKKKWDELDEPTKQHWIKRFQDAGHWTESFAQTVLKSVVFGEIAGAVAAAVA